jgi:hypothetical protein
MVGKRIRRASRGYHYFFVKPGSNSDAHKAAARLMAIAPVKEVCITEGAYGFVVKSDEIHDGENDILDKISKATKGRSSTAICHCRYVRR